MNSQLKTNKKGRPYLEVFYSGSIADANRAIEKEITEHGLNGDKVTVLAYPKSMENQKQVYE